MVDATGRKHVQRGHVLFRAVRATEWLPAMLNPTDLKDGCVSSLGTFTSTIGIQSYCQIMIRVSNHLQNRNVLRFTFHHHSQARNSQVIGWIPREG